MRREEPPFPLLLSLFAAASDLVFTPMKLPNLTFFPAWHEKGPFVAVDEDVTAEFGTK